MPSLPLNRPLADCLGPIYSRWECRNSLEMQRVLFQESKKTEHSQQYNGRWAMTRSTEILGVPLFSWIVALFERNCAGGLCDQQTNLSDKNIVRWTCVHIYGFHLRVHGLYCICWFQTNLFNMVERLSTGNIVDEQCENRSLEAQVGVCSRGAFTTIPEFNLELVF